MVQIVWFYQEQFWEKVCDNIYVSISTNSLMKLKQLYFQVSEWSIWICLALQWLDCIEKFETTFWGELNFLLFRT